MEIQAKWRNQIKKINARVQVFIICWNEFCNKLLEEAKVKKDMLSTFSLIKKWVLFYTS